MHKTAQVTPAADQNAAQVGDTIAYSYLVTNTGNVTLASVAVDDPTIGAVTCPTPPAPGLAPGASETCTADATHTVTQADVDSGSVVDTATATGTDTQGDTSPAERPVHRDHPDRGARPPRSAIAKTGTVTPAADQDAAQVGDTIAYSYLVTNTGNVTLASVAVNDPTARCRHLPHPARSRPGPRRLGDLHRRRHPHRHPGRRRRRQRGRHRHRHRHRHPGQRQPRERPRPPSTIDDRGRRRRRSAVAKTGTVTPAADQGAAKVGDTIAYTYVVTNTGNVTLASVAVDDPTLGPVTCPDPGRPRPGPRRLGDLHRRHAPTR